MMIDVKYFSKTTLKTYKAINLILIASFLVIYIIYYIYIGIKSVEEAQWLRIILLCIISVLLVTNTVVFSIEAVRKAKVEKNVANFIELKQYNDAIEFLRKIASINRFYNINQMILYYLGYLELLLDKPAQAITYLEKFNLDKQSSSNARYLSSTIFLLYLIHYINNDSSALKKIHEVYIAKKNYLLKAARWAKLKNEMVYLFEIIDFLNNKDINQAAEKIVKSRLINIPIVERFFKDKQSNN